uniref:Uncharacterized protein n=1 Tax=Physcomitrium patens TaxID=3218 RepID=A0A2K1JYZ6_PHYPA|nr:hypothetical protein PHYPA_013860 [Physcomitrium patens]
MVQESVDVDLSEDVASLFMAIPTVEVTKIKVGNCLFLTKCVARETHNKSNSESNRPSPLGCNSNSCHGVGS